MVILTATDGLNALIPGHIKEAPTVDKVLSGSGSGWLNIRFPPILGSQQSTWKDAFHIAKPVNGKNKT